MDYSRILVDTSVFIEYLRVKNKEKWNDVKLLTEDLPILPFTVDLAEFSAKIFQDLKKRNQIIEFRDIFIASTAIKNNLPIKTINIKHFKRISGLKIL